MTESVWLLVAVAAGYLSGSVPYGLVLARVFCGIDPRTAGSCNIGTTNIARLCGKKWGAITLLCDALKGTLPVLGVAFATSRMTPEQGSAGLLPLLPLFTAAAAIAGHMFPVWLRFKGGKGVATTVGVFLALAPLELVVAGAACIAVIWRTGFVSAGSLVLSALLPALLFFNEKTGAGVLALCISAGIVWAHRENIKRLRAGTEKPWTKK